MTEHDTGDTISATEIASALGVGLSAVSNWRRRHRQFPQAVTKGVELRFQTTAVVEWLEGRKIPAPQRSPDEPEGTTYLDRFHHKNSAAITVRADKWPYEEFDRAATEAAKVLRNEGAVDQTCELLLALLWVLIERPKDWRRLRSAPDEAPDLLSRIDLPASRSRRLPLLPDTTWEAVRPPTWHQLIPLVSDLARFVPENGRMPEGPLLEQVERWLEGLRSDHVLPPAIAELMVVLADPTSGDTVVDPFSRAGELLAAAAAHGRERRRDITIVGRAPSSSSLRISTLVSLLAGADAELSSSLGMQDLVSEQAAYDVVVANPPFNTKNLVGFNLDRIAWRYDHPPAANLNFAWLQAVVSSLRSGGRAAVLTSTNAVQSRSSAERRIRSRMIDDGVVDGVVALPDRLFASTAIPTCLWLLRAPGGPRPTETLFVDATTLGSIARRGRRTLTPADVTSVVDEFTRWRKRSRMAPFIPTDGFSGYRSIRELTQGVADLNPRIHVASSATVVDLTALRASAIDRLRHFDGLRADTRRRQSSAKTAIERITFDEVGALGPVATVTLDSVCDVLSGPGNITTDSTEPTVPIVSPRNIGHSTVSDTVFTSAPDTARRDFQRYLLAPGDIIGVRSGNVGRFGLFGPSHTPWLLGSGCLRIRPRAEDVDPAFLVHLLGTEASQDWIRRRAAGSVLTTISADGIRELPISLPPLDEQREIGEILLALDAETMAHERAAKESARLSATVAEALTSGAVGLHSPASGQCARGRPTLGT